jgi:hypothetical protein
LGVLVGAVDRNESTLDERLVQARRAHDQDPGVAGQAVGEIVRRGLRRVDDLDGIGRDAECREMFGDDGRRAGRIVGHERQPHAESADRR